MRILYLILFFASLLILGSIRLKAQTVIPTGSATQLTYQRGGSGAERVFAIPALDTSVINALFPTYRDSGRVTMFLGKLYYHDGDKWNTSLSADSSVFATRYWVGQNYTPLSRTLTIQGVAQDLSANRTWSFTTTDIPEGSNQYFTLSRTRQSISVTGGLLSYDNTTGVIGLTSSTLDGSYWKLNGNATSSAQSMGSTTANPVTFITNNLLRDSIAPNGVRTMGTATMSVENFMNFRSSVAARFRWFIGLNGIFSTNALVLRFDNSGDQTNYTEISSASGNMTTSSDALIFRTVSGVSTTPVILGNNSTNTGDGIRIAPRIAWTGSFAPTTGTTTMVSWAMNAPNTNYTPASGSHSFIGYRFHPTLIATGTYAGSVQGFLFAPTVTSIASGTIRAFESTNNLGYANYHGGTALNYYQGAILQGVSVWNAIDGYQSVNSLRAAIIKSTNMNSGDLTDSIVVHDDATDEFQKIAPIYSLVNRMDTTIVTASNIALLPTVRSYWYSFTGTTATWTLPTVAGSGNVTYFIKNRGSGNLTINTNSGGNDLYENAPANTLVIPAGGGYAIHNDGTYFWVKN